MKSSHLCEAEASGGGAFKGGSSEALPFVPGRAERSRAEQSYKMLPEQGTALCSPEPSVAEACASTLRPEHTAHTVLNVQNNNSTRQRGECVHFT